MSSRSTTKTGLWVPSWHEMDQSLVVGVERRYWFFQQPPFDLTTWGEPIDLVFYNQVGATDNCQLRFATITRIWHPELGELNGVDTDGLDYMFDRVEGGTVLVNAEESPGHCDDETLVVEDWSLLVTLENVSEPIADAT